jgi:hypothetical protein
MSIIDLVDGDSLQVLLVVAVMGVLSGMIGKSIVGFLKRTLKLKGRKTIQPIAGFVCAVLSTSLCASVGLLTWSAAPVTAVIAWFVAEEQAKTEPPATSPGGGAS